MKKIRCFLAVDLSDQVAGSLSKVSDKLSANCPGVHWTDANGWHVTLKFFGEVDELATYEISKAVTSVANKTAPFDVRVAGIGAFPAMDRPRTIWVGISDGESALIDLQSSIDTTLANIGYPLERRRFHPHLTLGRLRDKVVQPAMVSALKSVADFEGGTALVDQVILYRSELHRHGPIYTTLATINLKRAAGWNDS